MDDRSFVGLVQGKIDYLRIAIAVPTTRATRETPMIAIWRLDRERFLKIANSIAEGKASWICSTVDLESETAEKIAKICDKTGIENRFFRLNSEVANWIDETDPEQEVDFLLL